MGRNNLATIEAIQEAMKIAVDRGMLPEETDQSTYLSNWETMEAILDNTLANLRKQLEERVAELEEKHKCVCEYHPPHHFDDKRYSIEAALVEARHWLSALVGEKAT